MNEVFEKTKCVQCRFALVLVVFHLSQDRQGPFELKPHSTWSTIDERRFDRVTCCEYSSNVSLMPSKFDVSFVDVNGNGLVTAFRPALSSV
jgi:hypothetical protein